jgi:hypothetical protein
MIQRKQTIFLLLAAVSIALLFLLPIISGVLATNGSVVPFVITSHTKLLVAAGIIIALALIAIFMYKNRQQQLKMVVLAILFTIGLIAILVGATTQFAANTTLYNFKSTAYGFGAALPILALLLFILAFFAIRSDEKLVKSQDRLR